MLGETAAYHSRIASFGFGGEDDTPSLDSTMVLSRRLGRGVGALGGGMDGLKSGSGHVSSVVKDSTSGWVNVGSSASMLRSLCGV